MYMHVSYHLWKARHSSMESQDPPRAYTYVYMYDRSGTRCRWRGSLHCERWGNSYAIMFPVRTLVIATIRSNEPAL